MQVVLDVDPSNKRTLQRQVFDQIRAMILDGKLRGGDPVPASRSLSKQLGISRNTVVIAYDNLLSEGYVESRPNVGMFVSSNLPDFTMFTTPDCPVCGTNAGKERSSRAPLLAPPKSAHSVISPNRRTAEHDFWVGRVEPSFFPRNDWRRITDAKIRHGGSRLAEYNHPQGLPELRKEIADHIGPSRGVAVGAKEIVVVGGSQDGLSLIAQSVCESHRKFVHEDPCYQGARSLFDSHGFECHAVPVDAKGIDVGRLPDIRRAVLYVTPSHNYPTGATLSLERRLTLLEWADRTDSLIIEDDYDGDFRYEGAPLTALHGLDRKNRVLYVGTFSKSVGPGLRLGYIAAPDETIDALSGWKVLSSISAPFLEQVAMAEFMQSGGFRRHLRRIRALYMSRRDLLISLLRRRLPEIEICGASGGMHLSVRLPPNAPSLKRLRAKLLESGVGVYCVNSCGAYISPGNSAHARTLILGYSGVSEEGITLAVDALADAMNPEQLGTSYV